MRVPGLAVLLGPQAQRGGTPREGGFCRPKKSLADPRSPLFSPGPGRGQPPGGCQPKPLAPSETLNR